MKVKTIASLTAAALLAGAALVPGTAAAAVKTTVVGKDEVGDWGAETAPDAAAIGDALGQDLVEARIGQADKKTLHFVLKLNSLPPIGGAPEFSRYVWDMHVDGNFIELDGKFTNYSRGACDPTSGQCPPPRDPGSAPFLVRGDCVTEGSVTTCQEIGLIEAQFDTEAATITIPVPMKLIKAKPGSKITGGTNTFGGSIAAVPSAFLSITAAPMDNMTMSKTYTVPKAKKAKKAKKGKKKHRHH